jgi:hypothetical protein
MIMLTLRRTHLYNNFGSVKGLFCSLGIAIITKKKDKNTEMVCTVGQEIDKDNN